MAESLAGRVVFCDLEAFNFAEACHRTPERSWIETWLQNPDRFIKAPPGRHLRKITLMQQMWRGWLPKCQFMNLDNIPDYYAAYMRTYIERDVRLLAEVTDLHRFGDFLRLAAALTAQEINRSQFGREIGISPQTAERWLSILKSTFQWFELPSYSGNTIKRISAKPKGYISDTGLACQAHRISTPEGLAGHPLLGSLFETMVIGEIRKQCTSLSVPPVFWHWKTHGGAEVDLVLERDGTFYPIEIKISSHPNIRSASGIKAFRNTYRNIRIAKGLIIAPVEEFYRLTDDVFVLPWDTI